MPHQQKLVHIADITTIGAAGNQVIATAFLLDGITAASVPVARQETTVECYGADPGATSRWWTTAITTAGFTLNWAGYNAGVTNLRIVSHVFHSICFDISSVTPPY